jgi:hypothetical protein
MFMVSDFTFCCSIFFVLHDYLHTMTLSSFITQFDYPGCIVLLEGKRIVRPEDIDKLIALGRLLASKTKHIKFRSGNAPGADEFFSQGVSEIDITRLQIIKPYRSHRTASEQTEDVVSLDDVNLAMEDGLIKASAINERTERLVKSYVSGTRSFISMKAAYLIRDTMKVMGAEKLPAANFAIFYDSLTKPMSGGTGHTMQVCIQNNVPLIDQHTWMHWLNE